MEPVLIHKPTLPILIVEDIKENQVLLASLCKRMELEVEIADNGQIALQMIQDKNYSIYIVDLMLPVMDGRTFIGELKKKEPDAVILVESAVDMPSTIIDIMKLGAFDYIIKPIDSDLFQRTVTKALEFKYLKDMEMNLGIHSGLKLRSQLEWLNYKEARRKTSVDSKEMMSIENLKTSLSQGAGVGAMVTLMDIAKFSLKEDGENYIIKKTIMDPIFDNNDTIRSLLDGMHLISDTLMNDFPLTNVKVSDIVENLPNTLSEVSSYLDKKKLKISFPVKKVNAELRANSEKISGAIEELVINAYKYSIPGGTIDLFTYISGSYFCFSVKNDVPEQPYGGIPPEYERLVLEPFFRLLPPDETIARAEKYGLGLGLTVVEHIARKHGGLFFIHDMKDHTGSAIRSCVVAQLFIPVKENENPSS